jgi:hypothetical protein
VLDELVQRTSQRSFAEQDEFRQALLFHRAQTSLREGVAGNWIGLIPPDLSVARNESQNFVSRSCSAYRLRSRFPQLSPVALRAICCIQASSGCRVIPAKQARRLSRWMKNNT